MKFIWFSAYDEQTSRQFGYTTTAEDVSSAIKRFKKDNPNGVIVDYGYYDEEEEE